MSFAVYDNTAIAIRNNRNLIAQLDYTVTFPNQKLLSWVFPLTSIQETLKRGRSLLKTVDGDTPPASNIFARYIPSGTGAVGKENVGLFLEYFPTEADWDLAMTSILAIPPGLGQSLIMNVQYDASALKRAVPWSINYANDGVGGNSQRNQQNYIQGGGATSKVIASEIALMFNNGALYPPSTWYDPID